MFSPRTAAQVVQGQVGNLEHKKILKDTMTRIRNGIRGLFRKSKKGFYHLKKFLRDSKEEKLATIKKLEDALVKDEEAIEELKNELLKIQSESRTIDEEIKNLRDEKDALDVKISSKSSKKVEKDNSAAEIENKISGKKDKLYKRQMRLETLRTISVSDLVMNYAGMPLDEIKKKQVLKTWKQVNELKAPKAEQVLFILKVQGIDFHEYVDGQFDDKDLNIDKNGEGKGLDWLKEQIAMLLGIKKEEPNESLFDDDDDDSDDDEENEGPPPAKKQKRSED